MDLLPEDVVASPNLLSRDLFQARVQPNPNRTLTGRGLRTSLRTNLRLNEEETAGLLLMSYHLANNNFFGPNYEVEQHLQLGLYQLRPHRPLTYGETEYSTAELDPNLPTLCPHRAKTRFLREFQPLQPTRTAWLDTVLLQYQPEDYLERYYVTSSPFQVELSIDWFQYIKRLAATRTRLGLSFSPEPIRFPYTCRFLPPSPGDIVDRQIVDRPITAIYQFNHPDFLRGARTALDWFQVEDDLIDQVHQGGVHLLQSRTTSN